MPNWSESMQHTFEYYVVDPVTWKDVQQIKTITSSSISRDSDAATSGSASITTTEIIEECYIRIYLITIQNRVKERIPLGTYMVETPSYSFDGKNMSISLKSYTPLIELKEKIMPLGYFIRKGANILEIANQLCRSNMRAPVIEATSDKKLYYNYISENNETMLDFISGLISNAKMTLDVDELGQVMFRPNQNFAAMSYKWTYNDDNSSILSANVSVERDYYGIPNVIEVNYSSASTNVGSHYHVRIVNDDPSSPVSTVNRGREIIKRIDNPDIAASASYDMVVEYAKRLLEEASTITSKISYSHGYCPVRVGDCVRFNYERAGLTDIRALVVSQDISCETGCTVSETALFVKQLWEAK